MKPQLLKVPMKPSQSFSVRQDFKPFCNRLHYHPEIELLHFDKGKGTQFVGDSIKTFEPGDILLIGSNLPHCYKFEANSNGHNNQDVKIVHFSEDFLGNVFLNLPENKLIKDLLEKCKRGIKVIGGNRGQMARLLKNMLRAEGAERIIFLIQILLEIVKSERLEQLSSIGFELKQEDEEHDRLQDVYAYSYANFKNKISIAEIAKVAKLSPHSFCRYFKSRTKRTYFQFLTEIKIGQACKLLVNAHLSVKQICYESGFNNFASFHNSFKNITGTSPLVYQKRFIGSTS